MTTILKKIALFCSFIIVCPLVLLTKTGDILKPDTFFNTFSCALSLIPGKIGSYIRVAYYMATIKKISPDVTISFGSFFSRRTAEIGRNVYIGAYCILGNVDIKDNVLIASRVSIPSGRYQHGDSSSFSDEMKGTKFDKVTVGRQTWIGEGAIVMCDVGDNCIIGSGSVVTRSIPNNTVAVGNPTRPIKERKNKLNER